MRERLQVGTRSPRRILDSFLALAIIHPLKKLLLPIDTYFRSTCPSWLLVAAKCSGLFTEYEVKNVTCVCYPQNAAGGHLLVFDGEQSGIF